MLLPPYRACYSWLWVLIIIFWWLAGLTSCKKDTQNKVVQRQQRSLQLAERLACINPNIGFEIVLRLTDSSTPVATVPNSGDICKDSTEITNLMDGLIVRGLEVGPEDTDYMICVKMTNGRWYQSSPNNPYAHICVTASSGYGLPIWLQIALIVTLLILSGIFSGLNLGLLSLDENFLEVVIKAGTEKERKYATVILPVRKKGNYLLCTLLFGNVFVNVGSTVLTDNLTKGLGYWWISLLILPLVIVLVGEIIPQSVCTKFGLAVGAYTIWLTRFFMWITAPLSWPVSKVLDRVIGKNGGTVLSKERLVELIKLTIKENVQMKTDEFKIVQGALEYTKKTVREVMTPIEDVFMVSADMKLDVRGIAEIVDSGYTRIPVYRESRNNLVAILNVKDLALLDPDDGFEVHVVCSFYSHPVRIVAANTPLNKLLVEFKRGRYHLAFVRRAPPVEQQEEPAKSLAVTAHSSVRSQSPEITCNTAKCPTFHEPHQAPNRGTWKTRLARAFCRCKLKKKEVGERINNESKSDVRQKSDINPKDTTTMAKTRTKSNKKFSDDDNNNSNNNNINNHKSNKYDNNNNTNNNNNNINNLKSKKDDPRSWKNETAVTAEITSILKPLNNSKINNNNNNNEYNNNNNNNLPKSKSKSLSTSGPIIKQDKAKKSGSDPSEEINKITDNNHNNIDNNMIINNNNNNHNNKEKSKDSTPSILITNIGKNMTRINGEEIIGVVTLEDIIEEIIQGEIVDEHDAVTDNVFRKKRRDRGVLVSNLLSGNRHNGLAGSNLSDGLAVSAIQWLNANERAFRNDLIEINILERLVRTSAHRVTIAKENAHSVVYLYRNGVPNNKYILVLEGNATLIHGTGLRLDTPIFSYFGRDLMTKLVDLCTGLTPTKDETPDAITFVPDFDLLVTHDITYLEIDARMYYEAFRISKISKTRTKDKKNDPSAKSLSNQSVKSSSAVSALDEADAFELEVLAQKQREQASGQKVKIQSASKKSKTKTSPNAHRPRPHPTPPTKPSPNTQRSSSNTKSDITQATMSTSLKDFGDEDSSSSTRTEPVKK